MNIVIATPALLSPGNPFYHLFRDILESFLKEGHHITRLATRTGTADNNFTLGIDSPGIRYILFKRSERSKKSIIMRYLSDTLIQIQMAVRILALGGIDAMFEDVSYSSFWSVMAAKLRGLKIVSMVQDVWPDNAVQSGLLGGKSFIRKYFEARQRYVYRNSHRIICISEDIKTFLASKGTEEKKISVVYNWGYSEDIVDIPWEQNEFVRKFQLDKHFFYAVYAGNIGWMQNLDILVEASRILKNNHDVHFLIVGDGARREDIQKMIQSYALGNITLLPMQPSALAVHIYSAAGVNIIPLIPGAIKTALPSKTGICLSCGKPVIVCADPDSHFCRLIKSSQAGQVLSASDPKALAQAILECSKEGNTSCPGAYRCYKTWFTPGNALQYARILGEMAQ